MTSPTVIQQILHTLIDCSAKETVDALDDALDTLSTRDDTVLLVLLTR